MDTDFQTFHYIFCFCMYAIGNYVFINENVAYYTYITTLFIIIPILVHHCSNFVNWMNPPIRPLYRIKFKDELWKTIVHMGVTTMGCLMVYNYDYSKDMFMEPMLDDWVLNSFYGIQTAAWLYTLYEHGIVLYKRSDYVKMYFHHIVTLLLILGSFHIGARQIGLYVMILHDSSDIIVDLLKLSNYLGLDSSIGIYMVETMFGLNFLTWNYTRLYLFPKIIVLPAIYKGCYSPVCDDFDILELYGPWGILFRGNFKCNVFRYLLLFIQILNISWSFMFVGMAYKLILKGENTKKVGRGYEKGKIKSK